MSKYIVRNCPCFDNRIWQEPTCNINPCDCQNVSDCFIKQVIEKCKAKTLDIYNPIFSDTHYGMANSIFSKQILDMFDIQEVEE